MMMKLPSWDANYAATVQAVAALIQAILTVVAVAIAIGVPMWQQRRARAEGASKHAAEVAGLRLVLYTEVAAVGQQCLLELQGWRNAEREEAVRPSVTAHLPPLTIYPANANQITLLTRAEILPLMNFSGTLMDLSSLTASTHERIRTQSPAAGAIQALLSNACRHAADFLEAVPGIEGGDSDRSFVAALRDGYETMAKARASTTCTL